MALDLPEATLHGGGWEALGQGSSARVALPPWGHQASLETLGCHDGGGAAGQQREARDAAEHPPAPGTDPHEELAAGNVSGAEVGTPASVCLRLAATGASWPFLFPSPQVIVIVQSAGVNWAPSFLPCFLPFFLPPSFLLFLLPSFLSSLLLSFIHFFLPSFLFSFLPPFIEQLIKKCIINIYLLV